MIVKCIDDSYRPNDIPLSYWIKKESIYTVINSYKDMNGTLLFELEEIDLKPLGLLYKGFSANRFKPLDPIEINIEEEVEEFSLTF